MESEIQALLNQFQFETLAVEGTFYKQTYRSSARLENGNPVGTAMIGMLKNYHGE